MSRFKYCDTIWWITEIMRILAIIGVVPLAIVFRTTLYNNNEKTIFETITITIGILVIYVIYYYWIDKAIVRLRKKLHKVFNKNFQNGYSHEKINRIKAQMEDSTKFEEE